MKPEQPHYSAVQMSIGFSIREASDDNVCVVRLYPLYGVLWVTDVWTDAAHRNKKLASRVMQKAIDTFGDYELHLHVLPYMDRPREVEDLVGWYESFGFEAVDDFGHMYRSGKPFPFTFDPIDVPPVI